MRRGGRWALAAALAAASGSCAEGVDRVGDDCTPFERRFCRCADGATQGSQRCGRDGRSYSECGPCAEGGALAPGCDNDVGCVVAVCAADPYCCANGWDDQCVERASLRCATAGSAACGG